MLIWYFIIQLPRVCRKRDPYLVQENENLEELTLPITCSLIQSIALLPTSPIDCPLIQRKEKETKRWWTTINVVAENAEARTPEIGEFINSLKGMFFVCLRNTWSPKWSPTMLPIITDSFVEEDAVQAIALFSNRLPSLRIQLLAC